MIFVTLILAVDLLQRTESSPPKKTIENIKQLQSQIQENEAEIKRLSAQVQQGNNPAGKLASLDVETLRRKIANRTQQNQVLASQIQKLQRDKVAVIRRQTEVQSRESTTRRAEEKTIKQLKDAIRVTREKLRDLGNGKRVIYNVAKGNWTDRWIVQVSGRQIVVAPIGRKQAPRAFNNPAAFQTWSSTLNLSANYFLLIVKPDGIGNFKTIRAGLRSAGAALGFDLIGADQSAVDTKSGGSNP